jgi:hypothetical protein
VWQPGQDGPKAISRLHSHDESEIGEMNVGASVLMICSEQDADTVRNFEDGVALLLKTSTWTALREALLSQRSLTIEATDDWRVDLVCGL